jgi:cytochrome c oxidase subunit 2
LPTFNPASPQAAAIQSLFLVMLAAGAAILLIVVGLLTWVVVRYRARPGDAEPPVRFGEAKLEIARTTAAILVVGVLFLLTIRTMRAADQPPGGQSPDIVVVGHQWWWEIRYPAFGIVTANEIHVPAGERSLLRLESADVIHDLWIPQLGRKMDMIPGHPNHVWFEPRAPGTYPGACSEYCGTQHAWMRVRVVAQAPSDFEAWRGQQLKVPSRAMGAAADGAELFQSLTCPNCHAIGGTPANARIGPDLTHLAARETLGAGVLDNTPANLASWLADPQSIKPGSNMPNLRLSQTEVEQLVAYMETLR